MTLLLQTVSHAKPQKGLSHPLNTEKLTDALSGVPQFEDIKLHYVPTTGDALASLVDGQKLHGADATKLDGYGEFLECSWTREDGWNITLHAVASSRKSVAAQQAAAHALPRLRSWLETSRADSWFIGRRYMQFGLSEFTDELAMREIHNDRISELKEFLNGEAAASA